MLHPGISVSKYAFDQIAKQMKMSRALLTRTSSGYRALKQAAQADLAPIDSLGTLMAAPRWFDGITPSLIFAIYTATLGPLLFGYHLVGLT